MYSDFRGQYKMPSLSTELLAGGTKKTFFDDTHIHVELPQNERSTDSTRKVEENTLWVHDLLSCV